MADNPRPLNDLPVDRARPGDYIVGLQGDNARRFQWPFVNGDAMALDADGNPTPDTSVYNPSDYPEGTVFRALNYPAAVDGGSMEFTLISGAWVWTHGTYRASNNNGSYVRGADGVQRVSRQFNLDLTTTTAQEFQTPVTFPTASHVDSVTQGCRQDTSASANLDAIADVAVVGRHTLWRLAPRTTSNGFSADNMSWGAETMGRWR